MGLIIKGTTPKGTSIFSYEIYTSPMEHIWVFPKIGMFPPIWMVKIMENPNEKWDDLGGQYPLFSEISIWV